MQKRFKPTKKQSRQRLILQLVKKGDLRTQDDLTKALVRFSIKTTQSSLSRDVAELGIVKQHGKYVVGGLPQHGKSPPIMTIQQAGQNLVVVKTLPGMASPVGISIDERKLHGIIGTVCGDDTVFVAIDQKFPLQTITSSILRIFNKE